MNPLGAALLGLSAVYLAWRLRLALTILRITPLGEAAPLRPPGAALPSVTILAAVRDEGGALIPAVRSWLAQDLPRLSVVVVDDRSSDGSHARLVALSKEDPRLVPVRIDARPEGWLGKCHALQQGLAHATGDFVLFTDGDVTILPGTLRRAAAWCEEHRVDHLALLPRVDCDSALQEGLTSVFFQVFLASVIGPGRLNRDGAGQAVGVGAFGLVRRSVLEAAGGFHEIRLQVGDDVALARLLVRSGARHRLLGGLEAAHLHWQRGVLGTIRGLEKNAFWGTRLSVPVALAVSVAWLLPLVPLVGFAFGGHAGLVAAALTCLAITAPHLVFRQSLARRVLLAFLHPLSVLLLVATLWNSMLRTLARGGISWRGDVITLAELRAGLKPLSWWIGRRQAPRTD